MVFSVEQRVFIVLEFHRLEHSCVQTRRSFQRKFHVRKGPSDNAIRTLFQKFERTGSVNDDRIGNVGRPCLSVTESNAEAVQQVIQQRPRTSVRRVASCTGLRRMSTHRLMRHSLQMFPYKIQTHQPLSPNAINARYNFANAMLQLVDDGELDVGNIWFSDEAYFHLDGYVNKQNSRIWRSENPHIAEPASLHSPKIMVWAAVSSKGIIGPFFREQPINAVRYLGILEEFVTIHTALKDRSNASWFMQDGARPHRTSAVFDFLNEHFSERVIALDYDMHTGRGIAWPPYSQRLKALRLFSLGIPERCDIPPNSTNNCRAETAHLY